jgi:hypothetical protein
MKQTIFHERVCGAAYSGVYEAIHVPREFLWRLCASEWRTLDSSLNSRFEVELEEDIVLPVLLCKKSFFKIK